MIAKSDPIIEKMLKELNSAYIRNNLEESMDLCQQLITLNAQLIDPYEILASIYEKIGDVKRMYMIKHVSAEIKQTDTQCWIDCARLASSRELSDF
jgi:hypothetical protein